MAFVDGWRRGSTAAATATAIGSPSGSTSAASRFEAKARSSGKESRNGNGTIASLKGTDSRKSTILHDIVRAAREVLAIELIAPNTRRMSRDDDVSFRVRPGRARTRDGWTARRPSARTAIRRLPRCAAASSASCSHPATNAPSFTPPRTATSVPSSNGLHAPNQ